MMEKLYFNLRKDITTALRDEAGQDLGEYSLLLTLIVVACVAAVAAFGGQLSNLLATVPPIFP